MEATLKVKAVVETVIYVDDLQAAEIFYRTVLGLRIMGKEPGRHVFFQAGEASVLLAFLADVTLKGDQLPPHGASGPKGGKSLYLRDPAGNSVELVTPGVWGLPSGW
jgi:catechol 2,3-dioxygenase-like lactoylglutathione lyase family enzyme